MHAITRTRRRVGAVVVVSFHPPRKSSGSTGSPKLSRSRCERAPLAASLRSASRFRRRASRQSTSSHRAPVETENQSDDALLDDVQRETFAYFLHEVNERNGLVADCTRPGWPCSIAATGFGLASYPGWRGARLDDARQCGCANARALRFFSDSVQDTTPEATDSSRWPIAPPVTASGK